MRYGPADAPLLQSADLYLLVMPAACGGLISLAIGGVVVDAVGIEALFWGGGVVLTGAGVLGLLLLGNHDFRALNSAKPA